MPVTKTAKRALRGSKRKANVNAIFLAKFEIAVRTAKKTKSQEKILLAISLADRAVSKRMIHQNKAARIKSTLSQLLSKPKSEPKLRAKKKVSRKKVT